MDTSETYIKMRLAAIPDLGMGTPPNLPLGNDGPAWVDYCVFIDRHGNYYYSRINMQPIGEVVLSTTMLERQDQLQEMLYTPQPQGYGYDKLISLKMFEWATEYNEHYQCRGYKEYPNSLKSMEQLWLAFLFAEKYGKYWDGSDWVLKK